VREHDPPAKPATFEDLYAQHADRVMSFLWLFGVAESHREDVAQEVWIDVHRSLLIYDPNRGSARAWIAGIARNSARDWKRTERRRPEFSTHTDKEPIATRTADADAAEEERCAALWSYFERAIPNEDQREAFVLHVVHQMTIEEVAGVTGARPCTVKWRIAMARRRLKEELTEDERRKLLAILPVVSVDGFVRALRETKFPEDGIARVWERVTERIESEGGSIHDQLGTPATAPSPPPPRGFTFSGPGLAGTLAGVFLLGAGSGAALYAYLSRDHDASMTTVDAEIRPAPVLTAEPRPEPAPTASLAPSVRSSPAPPSEAWLLDRAWKAAPAEALALADQHARLFPASSRAAAREEIAITALVKLGRPVEAEARARNLIRRVPQKRPAMETLLGRSLL
jgi:RNA polymerase sigma-70 factor, ECF subfamily